jgi:hypothetical protein
MTGSYWDHIAPVARKLSSLLPPKHRWHDADVRETVATLVAEHKLNCATGVIIDRLQEGERERAYLLACLTTRLREVRRLKRTKRRVVPFKPRLVSSL